jgi:hypothetical protein
MINQNTAWAGYDAWKLASPYDAEDAAEAKAETEAGKESPAVVRARARAFDFIDSDQVPWSPQVNEAVDIIQELLELLELLE